MKRIFTALLCLACLGAPAMDYSNAEKMEKNGVRPVPEAHRVAHDLENDRVAQLVDRTLDGIIQVGVAKLRDNKMDAEAEQIDRAWRGTFQGYVFRMGRDIGDHKPLSDWLAHVYDTLEAKLGIKVCRFFHLSDIKVLNFALPVVFAPCELEWDEKEFYHHFAHSPKYGPALAPVITYWAIFLGCDIPLFVTPFSLACVPVGTVAEWVMDKFIAPKLSRRVYRRSCGVHHAYY